MTALMPTPAKLDERVLAALTSRGRRTRAIADDVHKRDGRGRWRNRLGRCEASRAQVEDVRLILRGFEHLGKAVNQNGWWRRAA